MKRLASLKTIIFFTLLFSYLSLFSQAEEKMNVLFIAVDDLKPSIGSFGDEFAVTPNIDELSKSSTVFLNNHTQQAICGPSRASLMTGLRPDKTRVWDLKTKMRDMNPDIVTIPQYFKQNGYQTIGIGKIYDNRCVDNFKDKPSWSVPFISQRQLTFSDGYSFPANGFYQSEEIRAKVSQLRQEGISKGISESGLNKYTTDIFKPPYESADVPDGAYMDGAIANRSLELLENMDTSQPFFLAVGFIRPHMPFVAPKKYWDLYDPNEIKLAEFRTKSKYPVDIAYKAGWEINSYHTPETDYPHNEENLLILEDDFQRKLIHGYYAASSYIDAQIGKLVDKLKEKGLDKNTIIVIWGDHGFHLGDHSQWTKHTNFEQSTRSPLLIKDPRVNEMYKISSPTEFVDIFPTLCDMTNLEMPQNLDGISLKPQIEGENTTSKIFAVSQYPRRSRTSGETMGYSFRSERYRYTVWVKNKKSTEPISNDDIYAEELYDYKTDPNETENKAGLENYQRIKTQFVKLANGFFNSQILEKPTVVKSNVISQNIMTNDRSNSWADKRSKIIGNYIAGEMLMNKNQKEFIIDVLYSKYARNNNLTADNNLTDNQKETIYKETFSLIKDILLEKFTKKQVDSILKYESEKLSTPKEKNNISAISSLENESFLVGSTLIHRELSSNYANLFLKDFKYLTAMNAAKQSNINPTKGSWKWNQIDNFAKFSKDNNLLFRLHSPIGPQCSKWIKDDARTADELQASLDEFLFRLLDRYKDFDNIKWIDVVNETILASGKWLGSKPGNSKWENPWLDIGLDENGYPLYIIRAFELADKYAPNKKLVYNQNGGMQIPMWEKLKETVMYLKSKGQRVDGIGWQGHLMNNNGLKQFVENLDEELKKLSDLIDWAHSNKLEFHITELDYYNDGENNIFNSVKKQAEVYQKLMDLLQEKSKNGLVTVNFWSMGERISSRGKKGHYMSIYDNDTIPTKTYEVVKKFINFD